MMIRFSRFIASVLLLCFVSQSVVIAAPKVRAEGMNESVFNSGSAGSVDTATGTLRLTREDVRIPGPNGFDIVVNRTYNSKVFKSSPKWFGVEGDGAFHNKNSLKTVKEKHYDVQPTAFGGWIGQGWRTNIGGRLVRIYSRYDRRVTEMWGMKKTSETKRETEMIVLDTGEGTHTFERFSEKGGHHDDGFKPVDKGDRSTLERTLSGFLLKREDGTRFFFGKQYYKKRFHMQFESKRKWKSKKTRRRSFTDWDGFYLNYKQDVHGNRIEYDYEQYADYKFEESKEKIRFNVFNYFLDEPSVASAFSVYLRVMSIANNVDSLVSFFATLRTAEVTEAVENAGSNPKFEFTNKQMWTMRIIQFGILMLASGKDARVEDLLPEFITNTAITIAEYKLIMAVAPQLAPFYAAFKAIESLFLGDTDMGYLKTNLTVVPMRPIRIRDSVGNTVDIVYRKPMVKPVKTPYLKVIGYRYNSETKRREPVQAIKYHDHSFDSEEDYHSQISELRYSGPQGRETVYYSYTANGQLAKVSVDKGSRGKYDKETYAYTYFYTDAHPDEPETKVPKGYKKTRKYRFDHDIAEGQSYDLNGALLTEVNDLWTGVKRTYDYAFVHAKTLVSSLDGPEDASNSSFVLTKRTVEDHKDVPNRLKQTWVYDGYDTGKVYKQVVKKEDSTEKRLVLYFPNVSVTDPKNRVIESEFKEGLPYKVSQPMSVDLLYRWDFDNRWILQETERRSGYRLETQYSGYDDYGYYTQKVESGTRGPVRTTRYTYERSPLYLQENNLGVVKRIEIKDTKGLDRVIENQLDAQGRGLVLQSKESYGGPLSITTFEYDSFGNVIKQISPAGHQILTQYDRGTFPVSTTKKSAGSGAVVTERQDFYPHSRLVRSKTDWNGNLTRFEYDKRNRIVLEEAQKGGMTYKTEIEYSDRPGRLKLESRSTVSDGSLDKTVTGYFNGFSKVYRVDVEGKGVSRMSTEYQYDNGLNITKVVDALGQATVYRYDDRDRVVETVYPGGDREEIRYIDSMNRKTVVKPNGNEMEYTYNRYDHLYQVRPGKSSPVRYIWNSEGALLETLDSNGNTTKHTVDGKGQRLSTQHPSGEVETWSYDAEGNVTKHTRQDGVSVYSSGYDVLGRVGKVRYSTGTEVVYGYDRSYKGVLSDINVYGASPMTLRYEYNGQGQLILEDKRIGDIVHSIQYRRDGHGNELAVRDSLSGLWETKEYDSLGRLTELSAEIEGRSQTMVQDLEYDDLGRITNYSVPITKSEVSFVYDARGRVTNKVVKRSRDVIASQVFTYDGAGNRLTLERHVKGYPTVEESYVYDDVDQLIEVRQSKDGSAYDSVHKYRYDAAGNRLELHHDIGKVYAKYGAGNQVDSVWRSAQKGDKGSGWYEYDYDARGRRLRKVGKTQSEVFSKEEYVWNEWDRLAELKRNGEVLQRNMYDVFGLRVHQSILGGADISREYVYNKAERLLSQNLEQQGKTRVTRHITLGTEKLAEIRIEGNQQSLYWYYNDPLGTPIAIEYDSTDKDTANNGEYRLDMIEMGVFGNTERTEEVAGQEHDREFTGKYYDNTGLYNFHARFYDPELGRFISYDAAPASLEQPLSLNRYSYVYNNPLKFVDPDGNVAVKLNTGATATVGFMTAGVSQTVIGWDFTNNHALNPGNTNVEFIGGISPTTVYGSSRDISLSIARSSDAPKGSLKTLSAAYGFHQHTALGVEIQYSSRGLESLAISGSFGPGFGLPGFQIFGGSSGDTSINIGDMLRSSVNTNRLDMGSLRLGENVGTNSMWNPDSELDFSID